MNSAVRFGSSIVRKASLFFVFPRKFCNWRLSGDESDNGFYHMEEPLNRIFEFSDFENGLIDEKPDVHENGVNFSLRRNFFETAKRDASRVLETLSKDCPGFHTKLALDELNIRISGLLVREVLIGILKSISYDNNKTRFAKLAYKFFVWSGQQEYFNHPANTYHLLMKIFAECGEYKAMWRLVDEMIDKGYPTTAQTFIIVVCTCGEAGLARKVVEQFIKSKSFNYRPFKHSYNAILHSLLGIKQYKLIEWVYQQMLADGFSPDVLTYNIVMCANYRLGKRDQFYRLLDEMSRNGFCPDSYTYNILLHVLGKGDKPLSALNLLNHMKEVGINPGILHFTTLIDGLSRSGNLEACKHFFDEIVKIGCMPDVVCYTVMITGYITAGELEKAEKMFKEMTLRGHVPNVFTYNSMIRGLCIARKFKEACALVKEMQARGCNPNFVVYSTLVNYLKSAGKLAEAHEIITDMVEKGQYVHLFSKIKTYKRC